MVVEDLTKDKESLQKPHGSPSDILSPFTQRLCSQRKENLSKISPLVLEKIFEKDAKEKDVKH